MNAQTFLDHFDTFVEAPGRVQRLRNLVLQLAFRGRLVAQDPLDGHASLLVPSERRRPLIEPFRVPASWEWARFDEVADSRLGKMLDKAKNSGPRRPYLRNANVQWFRFDLTDVRELRLEDRDLETHRLVAGDLVICEGGEPGRVAVCGADVDGMVFQKALHRARPIPGIDVRYLAYLFRDYAMTGLLAQFFTGATIKHLTGRSLANVPVPLPPANEQVRIVAKLDQLMGLCDELETHQERRHRASTQFRSSALTVLAEAATPDASRRAWGRVSANWSALTQSLESIADLRHTILELAVRGRLTQQLPTESSATSLLERTIADRDRFVRDRMTRLVADDPDYFRDDPLPARWAWAPLQNLARFIDYRGRTPEKTASGIPLITAKNIRRGVISATPREFIAETAFDGWMTRGLPRVGDVLFTTEAPMGNAAMVRTGEPFALAQRTINLAPYADFSGAYLEVLLLSPWFEKELLRRATGMTATGIKAAKLRLIRLPIPPPEEQVRIAARVEELMRLCDILESRLEQRTTMAKHLADSTVAAIAL